MQIDRKPNKILPLLEKGLLALVVFSSLGQCVSNASLSDKVDRIASRNIPVQVGQDRQVLMGERISEAQNNEQFVVDVVSSFSWVKRTTPEYQKECKAIAREQKNIKLFKQCGTGMDPGVITPYGKFTSSAYAYQHLIAPESREAVMKWVLAWKPPNFDTSKAEESRSMKITKVGAPEKFKEGKQEVRIPVEIEFSEVQGAIPTRKFNKYYWIYTQEFIKPTATGAKNPYSQAVEASQQRGLYLTRILPYTSTSF
jgi:hypothetical protein